MPHTAHLPVLAGKGAVEVRGSLGSNGIEGQAAWAATNHLALTASGLGWGNGKPDRYIGTELGAGYYRWTSERFMLALYAGAGYGAGRVNDTNVSGSSEVSIRSRYATAYAQPAVFWRTASGDWDLGVATRVYVVGYRRLLRTSQELNTSGATLVERNDAGLQQAQLQLLFEAHRYLSRRLTLSSRVAAHGILGLTSVYEPFPLLLNVGLTARLGKQ